MTVQKAIQRLKAVTWPRLFKKLLDKIEALNSIPTETTPLTSHNASIIKEINVILARLTRDEHDLRMENWVQCLGALLYLKRFYEGTHPSVNHPLHDTTIAALSSTEGFEVLFLLCLRKDLPQKFDHNLILPRFQSSEIFHQYQTTEQSYLNSLRILKILGIVLVMLAMPSPPLIWKFLDVMQPMRTARAEAKQLIPAFVAHCAQYNGASPLMVSQLCISALNDYMAECCEDRSDSSECYLGFSPIIYTSQNVCTIMTADYVSMGWIAGIMGMVGLLLTLCIFILATWAVYIDLKSITRLPKDEGEAALHNLILEKVAVIKQNSNNGDEATAFESLSVEQLESVLIEMFLRSPCLQRDALPQPPISAATPINH